VSEENFSLADRIESLPVHFEDKKYQYILSQNWHPPIAVVGIVIITSATSIHRLLLFCLPHNVTHGLWLQCALHPPTIFPFSPCLTSSPLYCPPHPPPPANCHHHGLIVFFLSSLLSCLPTSFVDEMGFIYPLPAPLLSPTPAFSSPAASSCAH
jgi:hypothetical protein